MDKLTKRPATPEEVEKTILSHMNGWNRCNPGFAENEQHWRDKLVKAEAEGYLNEVCECGMVFLAFHHYTTCEDKKCPFSDGVTMLERMENSLKEE